MPDTPVEARLGAQPVPLAEAVARAAAILGASRCAVLGGLATDIAGIEAAVTLAQRIGGVVDHVHAGPALADLEVMRQAGWIVTTPLQARARADLLVLVGPGIARAWPEFASRLAIATPPALRPERPRQVVVLGVDEDTGAQIRADEMLDASISDLPQLLGVLRARAAGRPTRPVQQPGAAPQDALLRMAALLTGARYGVALWSAAALQPLAIEMLCGLIGDLNRTTRFAGLPLGVGAGNAEGAVQATAWRTGFPPRTGFARGHAEHDPWRFAAMRMVESGEADAALWVASAANVRPEWTRAVPTVAVVGAGVAFGAPPEVTITVGAPGVDHDGVLHDPDLGTLAVRRATRPSAAPSAADVLHRIIAALPC